MKLNEFFTHTQDGFEQDKTYDPEQDISILDKEALKKDEFLDHAKNLRKIANP